MLRGFVTYSLDVSSVASIVIVVMDAITWSKISVSPSTHSLYESKYRVLSDVAKAGLNILSQRPPETSSNLPGSAPLAQHFAGPNAVDRWINNVLGEIEVGLCDSCTKGTRPGKGLIPYIEETTEDIVQLLVDLV